MQTNFFTLYCEQVPNLDVTIRLTKMEDGQLLVAVHPFSNEVTDKAKHRIPPIVLNPATAEVLNEKFFEAIQAPAKEVSTLFKDMAVYQKEVAETRKNSEMERAAREKEEKEKKEKKAKYEALMKKVADLEKEEKWGEAIGAMPNPKEYEPWADEIGKKLTELRSKDNRLSLFNS